MKEYIYVLSYANGKVYRIDLDEEDEDKPIEVLLDDYGFDIDEVAFMYSTVETDCIIKAKRKDENC